MRHVTVLGIFALLSLFGLYRYGPGIAGDFGALQTVEISERHRVSEGHCLRLAILATFCEFTILPKEGTTAPQSVSHLYAGRISGELVFPMLTNGPTSRMTVSTGYVHMDRRVIALGVVALLALVCLLGIPRLLKRRARGEI